MYRIHRFALPALVVLAFALAGCGGGGRTNSGTGQTGSVTGKVTAGSLPSQGGTVTASIDGKNISAPVAADGTFTLPNVPPGVYTLVVKSQQQAGEVVVVVSAGSITNVGAVDLVDAGQVAGLVTDSVTGAPIAGATVTVSDSATATTTVAPGQPPLPVLGAMTDGSGSYVIDGLPVGSYLVTVSKQGYTTGTLEVSVTAGATTSGDIRLVAATAGSGTMQGTVTETNSDGSTSPLSGVFVILSSNSGAAMPVTSPVPPTATTAGGPVILWPVGPTAPDYFAYTADDGTYSITGVPSGAYTATAIRPGFQTATQAVSIAQGQTATVNFTLALYQIPTGTVTGTVTDASTNAPIAGATVTAIISGPTPLSNGNSRLKPSAVALPAQPTLFNVTATTGVNGGYTLVVPTSTYAIFVSAGGYESAQQTVTVTNGATVTVNVALTAATNQTASLSGVVDGPPANGSTVMGPVAGATVSIYTSPILVPGSTAGTTASNYTTTTDSSGNYSIAIPTGVYVVSASTSTESSIPAYVKLFANTTENLVLQYNNVVPPGGGGVVSPLVKR